MVVTGSALAIYTPQEQVQLASEVWPLANRLAETEFVPKPLRGRPEAVMACMLKGTELGIPLMQSLSQIHVIEGRPTMSSELMRAVVQSRGHEIIVEESTSTRCIIKGRRNGATEWQRFTFTKDDAERAGVLGKDNWKKWPGAMLLARASSLLCRAVFADCLAGISYTVEELNDGWDTIEPDVATVIVDELNPPAPATAGRTTKARKPRTRPARRTSEPPAVPPSLRPVPPLPGEDDITDAEIVEPQPATTTTTDHSAPLPGPAQIAIALKAHGVTTSEDRGRAVRQLVGRPVASSKELTVDEITAVLVALNDLGDGVPFPFIVDQPETATLPIDPEGGPT
jgi:hypothetical protein